MVAAVLVSTQPDRSVGTLEPFFDLVSSMRCPR